MSEHRGASELIAEAVRGWPGVEVVAGERGVAFVLGRRELGHLHGDRVAHFAFPRALRAELLEAGRVGPHPVSSPGLAARRIAGDGDVREVVALLRLNYERLAARRGPAAGPAASAAASGGAR